MVYEGMCSDNEALLLIRLNHLSPASAPVCNISNEIVMLLYFSLINSPSSVKYLDGFLFLMRSV